MKTTPPNPLKNAKNPDEEFFKIAVTASSGCVVKLEDGSLNKVYLNTMKEVVVEKIDFDFSMTREELQEMVKTIQTNPTHTL